MIAETYSWRAVFFMIVPPGLIAMGFIWFSLSGNTARTRARLDWTGFLALSIAMTGMQLMIDRGQRLDWFDSPEIVAYGLVAGAAFWVFAVHSLTSPTPFVDLGLLRNRNFAIGLMIAFFMGMLAFTSLVLFPTLLHDLRGYPDSTIGELLAARGVGNWFAFLVVVPISRRFPRLTVAAVMRWRAMPMQPRKSIFLARSPGARRSGGEPASETQRRS
jgi:DHA2 family multidrug resistance protein